MSKIFTPPPPFLDPQALLRGLLACIALVCLLPVPAVHSACVCGYDDGRFTTDQPLSMDGDMGDWAAILADTDNNVCDGGRDNAGTIIPPQPDLDAVNGTIQSTGRDLIHFAYTWNGTHVTTYTERAASNSNVQKFIYYADTNNNGLMETGERMIFATWQGSNQRVELFLGYYAAANPGGDPLIDSNGLGDGYKLPGTGYGFPSQGQPSYAGTWGSSDGLKMEWSVPWSDLGIPPRTAFSFHVSSTNSTPQAASFPDQVDDNMGGCGGGSVSTQFADLTLAADAAWQGFRGTTRYVPHILTNTGNGNDVFDLASTAGGFTVSYYRDQDASGDFTPGDALLADTDGDGVPDSGLLAAGASLNLLIAYGIPDPSSGADVVTTATSSYDPSHSAAVTDTLVLADLTFTPDRTLQGNAGATVYAAHLLTNTGNGTDTFGLVSAAGGAFTPSIAFYRDLGTLGQYDPGVDTLLTDTDGDGSLDSGQLGPGAGLNLLIAYTIPNPAYGTAILTTTATSGHDPGIGAAGTDTIEALAPDITLVKMVQTFSDPAHGTSNPYAIPGAVMRYTIIATNSGGAIADADSVVLTDPIPTPTDLAVTGSPVTFADGAVASGLSFDPAADVTYYDAADNPVAPSADANGVDPGVRKIVFNPKGTFRASDGTSHPSFSIQFYVRVR